MLRTSALLMLVAVICGCGAVRRSPVLDPPSSTVEPEDAIPPPLIPRAKLFSSPDFQHLRMSVDGTLVAYLAPYKNVQNIWVQPLHELLNGSQTAKPATFSTGRGIEDFDWTYLPGVLVFSQDKEGDENWRLWKLNVTSEPYETTVLSDTHGVQANIEAIKPTHPEFILVALNDRDSKYHDLYSVDLYTGKKTLIFENNYFGGYINDNDMKLRIAYNETDEGGNVFYKAIYKNNKIVRWEKYYTTSLEDSITTFPQGFDKSNKNVYWVTAESLDLGGVYIAPFDIPQNISLIYAPKKGEMVKLFKHPQDFTILAAEEEYKEPELHVVNETVRKDVEYLNSAVKNGRPQIVDTSLDFSKWLIAYIFDDRPSQYHLYDRKAKKVQFIFSTRKKLEGVKLSRMHGVEIKTRDGLTQVCYLSLPVESDPEGTGRPLRPIPMVLDVHGGPWARDNWGMSPSVQLYTNRGYAVMQCNYRGSTGYGRSFLIKGYGQWGGTMHNDLLDAVQWAIDSKVAIPSKIAIEGGSYGGYAALVGMTFTPDVFACGIDLVGPSNLITLLETIPEYWKPAYNSDVKRIGGDPRTEQGRKALIAKSPITFVSKIAKPLLIAQGANDPRVNRNESDQIVNAMKKNNIPVTYLLYTNEGHGFHRPENQISYHALEETFLSKCLGGRFEPITDAEIKASSVKILEDSIIKKAASTA